MKKVLALVSVMSLAAMASAIVDVRVWIAPVSSTSVAWTGTGTSGPTGPFSPTAAGTGAADGGTGAQVYTTAGVGTAGLSSVGTPGVPIDGDGASGETYAILARTDSAHEAGSAIRGMNLVVSTTGDVAVDYAWTQWRAGTSPNFTYRWESSSDFVGNEVTLVGGLGGPGRGWVLGPTGGTADRLDMWEEVDPDLGTGRGSILLGYIRTTAGSNGDVQIRLGANGINHAEGTTLALGDSSARIDAGVGAPGRGSGAQLQVVPEPASLVLLGLAGLALRRRK